MFVKPSFKDIFGPEIRQNIINRYGRYTSQSAVIKEGLMYALDMCLEFQRKSEGLLSQDWINHISSEVYEAINNYVYDITSYTKEQFLNDVSSEIKSSNVQINVDNYYNRI